MEKQRQASLGSAAGILLGIAGVVGGLLIWKLVKGKEYNLESADGAVAKVVKKIVPKKKKNRLVSEKSDKVIGLLKYMKAGKSYSQVALQEKSGFPYRSVRRYVDSLVQQKKVISVGYGRGKVFKKA